MALEELRDGAPEAGDPLLARRFALGFKPFTSGDRSVGQRRFGIAECATWRTTPPPTGNLDRCHCPAPFDIPPAVTTPRALDVTKTAFERRYEGSDWGAPECRTLGVQPPGEFTNVDTFPQRLYRLEFKKMDGKTITSDAASPAPSR